MARDRGVRQGPSWIMHALLSQWIRPVKRSAAAESNLIQKTTPLFLHKDEALLCTQTKTNSSQITSTSVFGGSLCLPVCTRLLCKFQQPAQNKPEFGLDGFISHLLQAQTTSIEERKKLPPLGSRLPRSPGPAWQQASLRLLQLGPDVT